MSYRSRTAFLKEFSEYFYNIECILKIMRHLPDLQEIYFNKYQNEQTEPSVSSLLAIKKRHLFGDGVFLRVHQVLYFMVVFIWLPLNDIMQDVYYSSICSYIFLVTWTLSNSHFSEEKKITWLFHLIVKQIVLYSF